MATLGVIGYGDAPAASRTDLERRRQRSARDAAHPAQPPPVAVARRNARERNRVKQVNNGFATLRQHIPTAIAASFEAGAGARGAAKKLSKVETLRMAVEYIRRLEDLLALSGGDSAGGCASSASGDDAAQQLLFGDGAGLTDAELEVSVTSGLSLLHPMHHSSASLSPEVYSEHSLSPVTSDNDTKPFVDLFGVAPGAAPAALQFAGDLGYDADLRAVKSELLSPGADSLQNDNYIVYSSDHPDVDQSDMIEVMWWDQQQKS